MGLCKLCSDILITLFALPLYAVISNFICNFKIAETVANSYV